MTAGVEVRQRGAGAHVVPTDLTVIRGGESRQQMVRLNREDPAAVDQALAARKDALEQAVAAHSSL